MAQLSDDCFAFGGPMLSVEDAVALLASRLGVVEGSEADLFPAQPHVGRSA